MAAIHDTLRRLLENPELRNALAEAFYTGIESPSDFDEYDLAEHLRHAPRRLWHDKYFDLRLAKEQDGWESSPLQGAEANVRAAIQSLVVARLPKPAAITLEELERIAHAQLGGVPLKDHIRKNEAGYAYQRFVECSINEIGCYQGLLDGRKRGEFPFYFDCLDCCLWPCATAEEIDDFEDASFDGYECRLWTSSASGFCLSINNFCRAGRGVGDFAEVEEDGGGLTGFCTLLARQRAEEEAKPLIKSIIHSARLAGCNSIASLAVGKGSQLISGCMSALWPPEPSGSGKQVSILNRLHNAIHLLSFADQAGNDPVALALSFAAIESLVCEKDEVSINKQIKRHVATLLVQDPNARKPFEKTIGSLYDIRSQVMHGDRVGASAENSLYARSIAARVLRSVISWMDNQVRMGGDTSWKEFMDEVNAASRKPGNVGGVD